MDESIPGYTVIGHIGEGGMATVYLAYQQNLERRVALKILPSEKAENEAFSERFVRETKIGASLFHRNIVPLYEGGRYKSFHYLVMEYLPNGNFKRRIEEGCDTNATLRIIYDVACALAYVHSKSYIHRDIKPENILFREDKSAVLTDFGIALDMRSNYRGRPASRLILGSPQYMSPEQARGEALDYRSDIYSLGAVLYEALAGHPLFESPATIADAVRLAKEPVPLLPPGVSWLQPLLEKMMAKDRDARFANMDAVIQALEPCLVVPTFGWGIQPPVNTGAYLNNLGKNSGPNVSPSAPTLIEDNGAIHDETAIRDNFSKPKPAPTVMPAPAARPRRRPKAGILALLLVLITLPLAYRHWHSLTAPPVSSTIDTMVTPVTSPPVIETQPEQASTAHQDAVATSAPAATQSDNPGTSTATSTTTPIENSTPSTPKTPDAESKVTAQPVTDSAQTQPEPNPTGVSAYDKYRKILEQDPHNQAARDGLLMVAIRFLNLSSTALNQDNLDNAQKYLDQASTIASDYHLGSGISDRIANQQFMVNRIRYLDAHKSSSPQQDKYQQ